jgi:hypothetical protein
MHVVICQIGMRASLFNVIGHERCDDPVKAFHSKSYIYLFLAFIGIAVASFAALVTLDHILGRTIIFPTGVGVRRGAS